jgi:hypothetical protein
MLSVGQELLIMPRYKNGGDDVKTEVTESKEVK